MTIATTTTFTVTRDDLIQAALRGLHLYGPTDAIPASDITYCAQALNIMVKAWAARGLMVWCVDNIVLPTVNAQAAYQIGSTASGTGSLVTNRPIRIISAYTAIAGVSTGMTVESRFDYDTIDAPATAGTPTQLFYDPQVLNGEIYLYPVPNAVISVHLNVQRQVFDFNLSTDNPDFPQEFYQALKWGLMDEVAVEYEASQITTQLVSAKAEKYFKEAMQTQDADAKYARTTLSTTSVYGVNRDTIIQDALIEIGKYTPQDRIPATDITHCARQLNTMMKGWVSKGLMAWCIDDVVLSTVNAQSEYMVGDTATGGGSLVTPRPIRIISAYVVIAGVTTGLQVESRFDYDAIDVPATAGTPTTLFYDPQVGNGEVYLYPTPNAVVSVHLVVQRQVAAMNLSTDNPDFPEEFYQAAKWGLIDEIAIGYKATPEMVKMASEKSRVYFDEAVKVTSDIDVTYARTTLSTTSLFGVNRDSIIQDALIEIGKFKPSDHIPSTDVTHCARQLNVMIKAWATKGMVIWCVNEVVLPLVNGIAVYPIGTTAGYIGAPVITTVGSGGTPGTYALTFTGGGGGTGFTGNYTIGAGGYLTAINITNGGTSCINPAPAISFPLGGITGAAGTVSVIGLSTNRPLRIMNAFIRDQYGNDTDLTVESRNDYNLLGNKTSPGTPNQLYYDPQLNTGLVTVYDVPMDALSSIHIIRQRQINEFNLATDNPDFPAEFYQALKWGLADEIALGYKSSPAVIQLCAVKAKAYLDEQMDFAQEDVSIFFQPRYQ